MHGVRAPLGGVSAEAKTLKLTSGTSLRHFIDVSKKETQALVADPEFVVVQVFKGKMRLQHHVSPEMVVPPFL